MSFIHHTQPRNLDFPLTRKKEKEKEKEKKKEKEKEKEEEEEEEEEEEGRKRKKKKKKKRRKKKREKIKANQKKRNKRRKHGKGKKQTGTKKGGAARWENPSLPQLRELRYFFASRYRQYRDGTWTWRVSTRGIETGTTEGNPWCLRKTTEVHGQKVVKLGSPETGKPATVTLDVMDAVGVILCVSKLAKRGKQVTFEHTGGSVQSNWTTCSETQERTSGCTVEDFIDVPDPRVVERTIEVAKHIPQERTVDDVPVPRATEDTIEAVQHIPQERAQAEIDEMAQKLAAPAQRCSSRSGPSSGAGAWQQRRVV